MDLKGSLVDTQLKIYLPPQLLSFLESITDDDIPANIAKLIGKNTKGKLNESIKPNPVQLSNKEYEKISKIKEYVKSKIGDVEPEECIPNVNSAQSSNNNEDDKEELLNEKAESEKDDPKENALDEKLIEKTELEEENKNDNNYLTTSDLNWLYQYLQKQRSKSAVPYLHEVLEGAIIETPENRMIKRNPVLEARCVKLRAQQEAREYRKMTKTVDNVRMRFPEDSISYQLKQLNRQLIAIGQFIISIFAGFLFGFRGVEWMVGNLDFGFRLLLGVMCALVIALAEIYFLAKKLNEELNFPETVQLGGPPKFANEPNFVHQTVPKKVAEKEHED